MLPAFRVRVGIRVQGLGLRVYPRATMYLFSGLFWFFASDGSILPTNENIGGSERVYRIQGLKLALFGSKRSRISGLGFTIWGLECAYSVSCAQKVAGPKHIPLGHLRDLDQAHMLD